MLPSVRRVVASSSVTPPAAAVLARSSSRPVPPSAAQIKPGQTIQQKQTQQQRRYSSSKPSSPDNGSKSLPGVPSSPSSNSNSSPASSSSSSSSPKRKRKAKDATTAATSATPRPSVQKLPSVPSTQHLPVESLALSAFFSQHRPISITHSLPKIVTDDAFAAIFNAPRSGSGRRSAASGKTSDVIRTLSRAVRDLEGPMAGLSVNGQQQQKATASRRQPKGAVSAAVARQQLQQQLKEDSAAAAAAATAAEEDASSSSPSTKIQFKNPDGSDAGSVYVQLSALSDQFLPFQPPPPPMPETAEADAAAEADMAAAEADAVGAVDGVDTAPAGVVNEIDAAAVANTDQPRTTRVFKAVLTIEEQLDENGEVRIVAHTPHIVEEGADDGSEGGMLSVSVEAAEDATAAQLPEGFVPRSFFERMALRQLRFEDALQRQRSGGLSNGSDGPALGSLVTGLRPRRLQLPAGAAGAPRMLAISVRRQKKLKMKKQKYKKLRKRTRTLRRKLDRN